MQKTKKNMKGKIELLLAETLHTYVSPFTTTVVLPLYHIYLIYVSELKKTTNSSLLFQIMTATFIKNHPKESTEL